MTSELDMDVPKQIFRSASTHWGQDLRGYHQEFRAGFRLQGLGVVGFSLQGLQQQGLTAPKQ